MQQPFVSDRKDTVLQAPAPKKAVPKRPNEALQKDSDESDSEEDSSDESDEEPQNKKAKVAVLILTMYSSRFQNFNS